MDQETEQLLGLVARTLKFATDHPYAATGIFGAAVGSAATYKIMTFNPQRSVFKNILTPKAYELALSDKDLQHLLDDPDAELRWETPEVTVVVTSEKREPLKELPIIDYEPGE